MTPTPTTIDNAIARLQDIVQECTGVTIKSADDYPKEVADAFPYSIAYVGSGNARFTNSSTTHIFPTLILEIHFNRTNLKYAYQCINAIALEFPRRLAKDPTLNGTVSTVIATESSPLNWEVGPFEYNTIKSQVLKYEIPFKTLQTPTT